MMIYILLVFLGLKRPNAAVLRLNPALTIDRSSIDIFLKTFTEIVAENIKTLLGIKLKSTCINDKL